MRKLLAVLLLAATAVACGEAEEPTPELIPIDTDITMEAPRSDTLRTQVEYPDSVYVSPAPEAESERPPIEVSKGGDRLPRIN